MTNYPALEAASVHASYDPESAVVTITYQGDLGADASAAAYTWLEDLLNQVGTEKLYGEIFDFRDVTRFQTDNLIDARKHSRRLNIMMETYHYPIAMIVSNAMQEEILRGPMRIVEGNQRKRIVHTEQEARAFLDEWHHSPASSA